jgi:hypothetical protein
VAVPAYPLPIGTVLGWTAGRGGRVDYWSIAGLTKTFAPDAAPLAGAVPEVDAYDVKACEADGEPLVPGDPEGIITHDGIEATRGPTTTCWVQRSA